MKRFCPNCSARLNDNTLTCPVCNAQSSSAPVTSSSHSACSTCGTPSDSRAKFCRKCGAPLGGTDITQGTRADTLAQAETFIKRKARRDAWRRPLGALKRTLSAMFHRGVLIAAISAVALLIIAFFVAVVAYVLWPITIAVIVIYVIGLVYTGRRYAKAYARLRTSTSISRLIELLQSSASTARTTASTALVLLGAEALPALERALYSDSDSRRQRAAQTLIKMGDPAVEPLVKALNDPWAPVRRTALLALGQMQNSRAIVPLTTLLVDTEPEICRTAAEFLGEFGGTQAVDPLIQALGMDDDLLKVTIADALGNIGDRQAIYPLTQLLESSDPRVHNAAAEALSRLGAPPATPPRGPQILPPVEGQVTVEERRVEGQVTVEERRVEGQVTVEERPVEGPEAQKVEPHEDADFDAWIHSLPFPLASILWEYKANEDVKEKLEHLLKFFEGLAIFQATLMLSELINDRQSWQREFKPQMYAGEERPTFNFEVPSFRTWVKLGKRLATIFRAMQKDAATWERYNQLLGQPDDDFVSLATDSTLYEVLNKLILLRNDLAHAGVAGVEESQEHLSALEGYLDQVRQIVSSRFKRSVLVSPLSSEYRDQVYDYKVKKLVGPYTSFMEGRVTTVRPMDAKRLYMLHGDSQTPIELLPFFKIIRAPRTGIDACYFFSKLVKDKATKEDTVRWVSSLL